MPSAVEVAVETYIRAVGERDSVLRARLLEACFSADCRMVTQSRVVRGPAEIHREIERFLTDPQLVRARVVSAIDARGSIFRYRTIVERADGPSLEFFDAGEIDAEGRISLLLAFAGPLGEAEQPRELLR
ncbi:MAG TPA: hypothetical protein VFQ61_13570 [Polyangiaceae bacterium]|nr:hypothetical protein [Polyangiaceae bacterium]